MKGVGSAYKYWHVFNGKLRYKSPPGLDCSLLLLRAMNGNEVKLSHPDKCTKKGSLPCIADFSEASKDSLPYVFQS